MVGWGGDYDIYGHDTRPKNPKQDRSVLHPHHMQRTNNDSTTRVQWNSLHNNPPINGNFGEGYYIMSFVALLKSLNNYYYFMIKAISMQKTQCEFSIRHRSQYGLQCTVFEYYYDVRLSYVTFYVTKTKTNNNFK